jgi:phosphonate transport system substrate-binding protein
MSGAPARTTRRAFAAAAPFVAMARSAAAARPVTLGLTPVFLDSDIVLVRQIEAYLTHRLGRTVQVVKRRTYREISSLLVAGQLDVAWICGFPFVQHREALSLVAAPLYRGAPLYRSYVIVRRERRAGSLADLRGDIHAFSDPDSNSGFLVTSAALAAEGQTASGFFARSFFTYGHRNVIRAVASGLAQSGSVDGYVWDVMAETEPGLVGATRLLRTSEPMGFPPIAASRQTDTGIVAATEAALLGMDRSGTGREILATLRLDGFASVVPSQFDGIEALWRRVREAG